MKKKKYIAKSIEEATKEAMEDLNAKEDEIIIIEKETKKALFNKKVEIEAITISDINKEIKDYLVFIMKGIGVEGKLEVKIREDIPLFNIITTDNILIGRNGKTIDAMQALVNQMLSTNLNKYYRTLIDVNDYKQNKKVRLEKLAKYTAKEVARSKIEVKLEPMNSYERRIIHNALTDSKDVKTESFGEEPNRYVVIKPKEE